ncbi:hypothetical protein GCK32_022657, partial [Trichostrongylus colubriformis]
RLLPLQNHFPSIQIFHQSTKASILMEMVDSALRKFSMLLLCTTGSQEQ